MFDPARKQSEENREAETPLHDTQSIVQRHLQNKDDVITDEDIRNVRVGDVEEVPTVGAEAQARFVDEDEKDNDETLGEDKKGTPWDVLT